MKTSRLPTAIYTVAFVVSISAIDTHADDGHLTLTRQGNSLQITTYPTEPQHTIVGGEVLDDEIPVEFMLTTNTIGGVFDGFFGEPTFTLTSDIFANTLGAGDFFYEVSVSPVAGIPVGEVAGHASGTNTAISDGLTRLERSFHVPVTNFGGGVLIGAHPHGQSTFVDRPGEYRVTLTAWDQLYVDTSGSLGLADSSPVSFQVKVGLSGDLDADGFVGISDLNIVLGNWNQDTQQGDPLAGDPSGDGFVGIEDLNAVLGNWNAGTSPPPIGGVVVPEPACGLLLLVGLLTAGRRGRHEG